MRVAAPSLYIAMPFDTELCEAVVLKCSRHTQEASASGTLWPRRMLVCGRDTCWSVVEIHWFVADTRASSWLRHTCQSVTEMYVR